MAEVHAVHASITPPILQCFGDQLTGKLAGWPGHTWRTHQHLQSACRYIVLGAVALRYGRTKGVRAAALAGALASFGYIVATAVTKDPLFFL
jgi:uncharacterized membrane protein SirB2